MKKSLVIIISFILIMSFVSAFSFGDFFGRNWGPSPSTYSPYSCSDKDFSQNLEETLKIKGITSNNKKVSQTDFCSSEDILIEYSCGNPIKSAKYNCSAKFGEDYFCRDGACVVEDKLAECESLGGVRVHPDVCGGNELLPAEPGIACCEYNTCGDGICQEGEDRCIQDCPKEICTDSDGGLNYYEKGIVNGLELPNITDTWQDYCGVAAEEGGNLVEYICDKNNYGKKDIYNCPNGCKDGACVSPNKTSSEEFKYNSYVLKAKVDYSNDINKNITSFYRFSNGAWETVCEDRYVEQMCFVEDLSLDITDIKYSPSGEQSVTISSNEGYEFNKIFDAEGNAFSVYEDSTVAPGSTRAVTFKEKDSNGNDLHEFFIVSYLKGGKYNSYVLKAKVDYSNDINKNITSFYRFSNGAWETVCEDRYVEQMCFVEDLSLDITDIKYSPSGEQSVTISSNEGYEFNKIFDAEGNAFSVYEDSTVAPGSTRAVTFKEKDSNGNDLHEFFVVNYKSYSEVSIESICTDSDGGLNYYEKGITYGVNFCSKGCGPNGENDSIRIQNWEDYCFDDNTLYDFTCNPESPSSAYANTYTCPNGCKDGACVVEENTLYDFTCNPESPSSAYANTYTCPNGCKDGACVVEENMLEVFVISENEIKSFIYEGKTYEVSISFIDADEVKLIVNGGEASTDKLMEGASTKLSDGVYLKILDIKKLEIAGDIGVIKFSLSNHNYISEEDCDGCLVNGNCFSWGYRIEGNFCSINFGMISQKEEGSTCDNNFECRSNLCVNDKCISGSLFQRMMEWFQNLFG